MTRPVVTDYYYSKEDYDTQDGGYVPLEEPKTKPTDLNIPEVLAPDKETDTDMYYTVTSQTGEVQLLPGQKTKTWGYNAPLLGKTIIFKNGKHIHIDLKNQLPELTTYHWHGAVIPGVADGGCHTPVYPGETCHIDFDINQPAATLWMHAHPCPSTAEQVWHGLATAVVVKDDQEATLPLPRNYGVDDIPLILQDRRFHEDNQWDYQTDYDQDGVMGPTPMINGTINPYFDVTTQKVRFRILNGANRREWRLHFSDDLKFTQIGGDCSLLPHPVDYTKVLIGCAERMEIVVDFGAYHPGDEVVLYSDDTPIVRFRIHEFAPDNTEIPETLTDQLPDPEVTPDAPIRKVVMSGMDESVEINGKKFDMQRIDTKTKLNNVEYWDVTNTNDMDGGMLHPYHMHGCVFKVVSRDGHAPHPNETGLKDTIEVGPDETVRLKVWFQCVGVFMYHCHIIEHEDGGMMLQYEVPDPKHPDELPQPLMDHHTLMSAFAKERGVKMTDLHLGGMESYSKMNMKM